MEKKLDFSYFLQILRRQRYIIAFLTILVISIIFVYIKLTFREQVKIIPPIKVSTVKGYTEEPAPSSYKQQIAFDNQIFSILDTPTINTSNIPSGKKMVTLHVSIYNSSDSKNLVYNDSLMQLRDTNGQMYSPVFLGQQPFITSGALFPKTETRGYLNYVVSSNDDNNYTLYLSSPGFNKINHLVKITF